MNVPSPTRPTIVVYGEIVWANQGQVVVSQQTPAHAISTPSALGKNRDRKIK